MVYDDVSDWLEQQDKWQGENEIIKQQILLLNEMCENVLHGANPMHWYLKIDLIIALYLMKMVMLLTS